MGDTGCEFRSLREAVECAAAYDRIIVVGSLSNPEIVMIRKPLEIVGVPRCSSTSSSSSSSSPVEVDALLTIRLNNVRSSVCLENITLKPAEEGRGAAGGGDIDEERSVVVTRGLNTLAGIAVIEGRLYIYDCNCYNAIIESEKPMRGAIKAYRSRFSQCILSSAQEEEDGRRGRNATAGERTGEGEEEERRMTARYCHFDNCTYGRP